MSIYFDYQGETLWNPATGLGRWYVSLAEAAAQVVEVPTGLVMNDDDTCTIDLDDFRLFVEALHGSFLRTRHPISQSLTRGILITSLVILERGGVEPTPTPEPELRDEMAAYSRSMAK